jgi:hypothetical protein
VTYVDKTRIFPPTTETSGWYDGNRLDVKQYRVLDAYVWLDDAEFFLERTPEGTIRYGETPTYMWSGQLCDGSKAVEIQNLVNRAIEELQPFYSFDKGAINSVFGSSTELLFRHEYDHFWYGKEVHTLNEYNYRNRVYKVNFHLENDKGGHIRTSVEGIEVMPEDFVYTPPNMIPDADEKVCFDDW